MNEQVKGNGQSRLMGRWLGMGRGGEWTGGREWTSDNLGQGRWMGRWQEIEIWDEWAGDKRWSMKSDC